MIDSSPYTFPQFLNGLLHFFVASYVAKYSALSSAVSLGNTLLWRFNRLYVLLRLSIAFVVYITFLTSAENLNIGTIASQFCCQLFIEFG